MKKIFMTGLFLALSSLHMAAQDQCSFPMMIVVPEQSDELSAQVQSLLEAKLRQVVTQNGMGGGAKFAQFCVKGTLHKTSQEAIAGMEAMVAVMLDLELSVSNTKTGEKFSSTAISLKGAGRSERLAYRAAVATVNANNVQLQQFMKGAKQKITQYYEKDTPNIIRRARTLKTQQKFEEALYLLSAIPACGSNYDDVELAILDVFQSWVDTDCAAKIGKARAIWNAGQDREAAKLAGAYLAAINPASSCSAEAFALADEIRERIGEEWEWAKDLKEFGKEMARSQVELEKMRIEAARAIGEAYGNNQQAVNINENYIVQ